MTAGSLEQRLRSRCARLQSGWARDCISEASAFSSLHPQLCLMVRGSRQDVQYRQGWWLVPWKEGGSCVRKDLSTALLSPCLCSCKAHSSSNLGHVGHSRFDFAPESLRVTQAQEDQATEAPSDPASPQSQQPAGRISPASSLQVGSAQPTGRLAPDPQEMPPPLHGPCRWQVGRKGSYRYVFPACWALCGLFESWGLHEPRNSHGRDVTPPSQKTKPSLRGAGRWPGSQPAGHDWGCLTAVPVLERDRGVH